MANENGLLPSGKLRQTMTIPSGTLNDKGCGSGRKKAGFLDRAVRLRRSAVMIILSGAVPLWLSDW